jgi:hypothetical protein
VGSELCIRERFNAFDSAWTVLGKSPLENISIPPGLFRW